MKDIHLAASRIVAHIGMDEFGDALIDALHVLVDFDTAALIAFKDGSDVPLCLAARAAPVHDDVLHRYLDHYFSTCEVIERMKTASDGSKPTIFRLNSTDIVNDQYRRDLYEQPGIGCEISLLAHEHDMFLFLGLYRSSGRRHFTADEEERLEDFWPLLQSSLIKHARLTQSLLPTRSGGRPLKEALVEIFQGYGVTPREAEVCSHIVSGYSSLATSLVMRISVNTVSTLRQRAYRKLNISCHAELYALCLQRMRDTMRDEEIGSDLFEGMAMPSAAARGAHDKRGRTHALRSLNA